MQPGAPMSRELQKIRAIYNELLHFFRVIAKFALLDSYHRFREQRKNEDA